MTSQILSYQKDMAIIIFTYVFSLLLLFCYGQIISRSTTSRCEMDVTFAGNSNEVTPWCKIEFNYRNDFDNYTRWKLREVIKVVVYLYNFFSVLLAWYKSKDCMSIDNGIFWENKASVSKKKFPVVFHWCSAGMKFIV